MNDMAQHKLAVTLEQPGLGSGVYLLRLYDSSQLLHTARVVVLR